MKGLTIKVFRTYNASITLSNLLEATDTTADMNAKKVLFDEANKEVAVLCNHQKSVGKGHDVSVGKLQEKKDALLKQIEEAKEADSKQLEKLECESRLRHVPFSDAHGMGAGKSWRRLNE